MCTAICYRTKTGNFFGRNLDLEYKYSEKVIFAPRNFTFNYKYAGERRNHYAMLGVASVFENTPMYYDGINEHGLCMAALNFQKSAILKKESTEKINLATFEIIPYILGSCKDTKEAKEVLSKTNLTDDALSESLPPAHLHFILSDKKGSITAEPLKDGMKIYENIPEILTNEPPFDFHINNLSLYMNLSNNEYRNAGVLKDAGAGSYCRGLFAHGLPGDLSSPSRFIRIAFSKFSSPEQKDFYDALSQTFHMLSRVSFIQGEIKIDDKYDITQYTAVADMNNLCYFFNSYNSPAIHAVKMEEKNLNDDKLLIYPLYNNIEIKYLNRVF